MARHIDILISAPPSIDFATFVGAQDERGETVAAGQWIAPDSECMFWRYRLTPAELLAYLIADTEVLTGQPINAAAGIPRTPMPTAFDMTVASSARAALKQRVSSAKPKSRRGPSPDVPSAATPDPLATDKCPACHQLFNPQKFEMLDCGACGESKCTARCFGNIAEPCLDCQALRADPGDPDDAGFDPSAGPEPAKISNPALRAQMEAEAAGAGRATGNRLFDGTFHGKAGDSAADEDD